MFSAKHLTHCSRQYTVAGVLALLMTVLLFPATIAAQCSAPDSRTKSGIVKIEGDASAGSGVVVAPGLVLTAAHVVAGMDRIDVVVQRRTRGAQLISRDTSIDLALLAVDTSGLEPLQWRRSALDETTPVWAVGYAFGKRLKTGKGKFRTVANRLIYTSAPVNFGQSGGGLLSCENGQHVLTGIIRAFGATKKNGKLVRRNDISVATRTDDSRLFVDSNRMYVSLEQ